MKKKICIFTGSRAEYSLLFPIIKEIQKNKKKFFCDVIVTGTHLSRNFGYTVNEIKKDKIQNIHQIKILNKNLSDDKICEYMGNGLKKFSKFLNKKKYDFVILLGDRYEILIAAISAMINRIKIVHIHGGEVTSGAYDDAIRHSISKMSSMHFVSHQDYKKRLIQLGENRKFIFNCGGLGAYNIQNTKTLSKENLKKKIKIKFEKKIFLITFHSTTLKKNSTKENLNELLNALSVFQDVTKVFTFNNADSDTDVIYPLFKKFIKNNKNAFLIKSLGRLNYLSLLKHCDVIIGNSSSGILEAPSYQTPTINIGLRQQGRVMPETVLNCDFNRKEITKKIIYSQSLNFKKKLKKLKNPLEKKNTIKIILKNIIKIDRTSLAKKFHDIS